MGGTSLRCLQNTDDTSRDESSERGERAGLGECRRAGVRGLVWESDSKSL